MKPRRFPLAQRIRCARVSCASLCVGIGIALSVNTAAAEFEPFWLKTKKEEETMRTRKKLGTWALGAMISAVAGTASAAEEGTLQQRVASLEKSVAETKDAAANALGIDFHALLSTQYIYSFNRPASGNLQGRVFDRKDNTFSVNDAALFISRNKEDEAFGFVLTVDFGDTAKYTGRDWNGDGDYVNPTSEESDNFELREAYLTYKLPWLGQTLKAGTFTTLLGYEVFKTPTNFNPNISNSILFGYSNPFTHTGLVLNTPLGDIGALDLAVVNGWDNFIDQNTGKTLLVGLGINPFENLTTYTAMAWGQEQVPFDRAGKLGPGASAAGAGSKRFELTMNATLKVTDELSFAMDSVYGNESDLLPGHANAEWYGLAGYAMVKANDWLSFSLRSEVFDDPDAARGFNATVWEITPTVGFQLTEHLLARVEYRHDEANKPIYEKDGRFQNGSDTIAGEMILAF